MLCTSTAVAEGSPCQLPNWRSPHPRNHPQVNVNARFRRYRAYCNPFFCFLKKLSEMRMLTTFYLAKTITDGSLSSLRRASCAVPVRDHKRLPRDRKEDERHLVTLRLQKPADVIPAFRSIEFLSRPRVTFDPFFQTRVLMTFRVCISRRTRNVVR